MSWGRNLGIGGTAALLLLGLRYAIAAGLSVRRRVGAVDEADAERQRTRDAIDRDLAVDRVESFELIAKRASERSQDKVQLFDVEHHLLGWGLRLGADPLGRPVIWVPPAIYGLASSAEGASGPIENPRFDDGGIEGPWDEEMRDRGRWKLPGEPGWAVPPERGELGHWSNET